VATSKGFFHKIFGAVLSDRVHAAWAYIGDSVDLYLTAAYFKSQPDHQLL
jgi:hypothetical protein